jgi:predicted nucleotidyltransferase
MTTRFGLSEATIQKICAVLARYPQVEKAVLYGSRATGNYRNGSDIDLALFGDDITLQHALQHYGRHRRPAVALLGGLGCLMGRLATLT